MVIGLHKVENLLVDLLSIQPAELLLRISKQRHFYAVRSGLLLNTPVMVIGSFASLLINLPLPVYQQAMTQLLGPQWHLIGSSISNATFGIVSLLLVLVISFLSAQFRLSTQDQPCIPMMTAITSLACMIALIQPLNSQGVLTLSFRWLGIVGIFPAILTALLASEIFLYIYSFKKIRIEVFDVTDPFISQVMAGILPLGITLSIFALAKFVTNFIGITDLHQVFYDAIRVSFLDEHATIGTAIKYHLMVQMLWFFGIHGQNALIAFQSLYTAAAENNMALFLAGEQPNEIFTSTFLEAFSTIGGTGSTLCLIIAILLLSKKGTTLKLAKLSLLPAIFNINEILVFGLPIVLNPIYLIPFLLVPIVTTVLAYTVTAAGFVPVTNQVSHWTTPVLLSGYLANRSWTGLALQGINIAVGVCMYLPFVHFANRQRQLTIQHALDDLLKLSVSPQTVSQQSILTRIDDAGQLSRVLAHDLNEALAKHSLVLAYQPQVDLHNRVTGVEALLRWPHKSFGPIPPPLIVKIAEESGIIYPLGKWIMNTACEQLRDWKARGVTNITMAVNVSTLQFRQKEILASVSQAIKKNGIAPQELEIEVTEGIALDNNTQTQWILTKLHNMGIRIAIDDFGMGHSSLTYIKNFPVDTLKIDKALSLDIAKDKNSLEIVATIIDLCASLHIKTIVEYVETVDQRNTLQELGTVHCQGYLYSPALPPEKALTYILRMNQYS